MDRQYHGQSHVAMWLINRIKRGLGYIRYKETENTQFKSGDSFRQIIKNVRWCCWIAAATFRHNPHNVCHIFSSVIRGTTVCFLLNKRSDGSVCLQSHIPACGADDFTESSLGETSSSILNEALRAKCVFDKIPIVLLCGASVDQDHVHYRPVSSQQPPNKSPGGGGKEGSASLFELIRGQWLIKMLRSGG